MSASSTPRRRPQFPDNLTNLHRFRKTAHGHDGSSRIVMVRKTDQRTILRKGTEPKLETVTRETIETFKGQRSEYKVTTEKKNCDEKCPAEVVHAVLDKSKRTPEKKKDPKMSFTMECLKVHNECRQKHGCPPLKLNKDICRISQLWADVLIRRSVPQQSNNTDYGEHIFSCESKNLNFSVSAREVVEKWYSEIKDHVFGEEPEDLKTGHFSQVIWKKTRELGVGFAKSKGRVVVVTNYYPPGNYVGNFAECVPPPLPSPPSTPASPDNNNTYAIENKMNALAIKNNAKKGAAENFEIDFLNKHNEFRRLHGVPPLKLDRKLCKYSDSWAEYLAQKNILQHRPESNYGENLFSVRLSNQKFVIKGDEPVIHWYNDMKDYPFGKEPKNLKKGGHFTQVVWRTSEFLGVGIAKNCSTIYVVANYSPAGNFVGDYINNVPPPIKNTLNGHNSSEDSVSENGVPLDGTEGNFKEDFLEAHNVYRRLHGACPLILDENLCTHSQNWAENLARTNMLESNPDMTYGENIYVISSTDPEYTITGYNPVDIWYEEEKFYDFCREPMNFHSLHFTQLVWKNTRRLGVGVAKSSDGTIYVVANYDPPGNYRGEYRANVGVAKRRYMAKSKSSLNTSIDLEHFGAEALKVHNEYRRKHGVPDVVLNHEICAYAQEWAETLAKKASLTHRVNNKYGENVAMMFSSDFSHTPSPRDFIKEWYNEVKFYNNYSKEGINQKALHFTQVIWKGTKEIGVGVAKNGKGQTYCVTNYNPRGNVGGKFVENVLKPKS